MFVVDVVVLRCHFFILHFYKNKNATVVASKVCACKHKRVTGPRTTTRLCFHARVLHDTFSISLHLRLVGVPTRSKIFTESVTRARVMRRTRH